MARRRIADEPLSRLSVWARRFAFFSLLAALLSVIILRSGFLEIEPALATFGGALLFAVLGILLALASFIVIWKDGLRGLGHSVLAIFIGGLLLAYPGYLASKAYKLPAIADITTDPIDPPRFEAIAKLRPRTSNPVAYAGLYAAEQQRFAYPDIEPLLLATTPKIAYDATRAVIARHKWRPIDEREPQPATRREGRIELVARTPVMQFRDDVVIRIRPSGEGTRVDIRSASRYGRHDFGTNAARVLALIEEIETTADAMAEEKQPRKAPPPPPAKTPPGKAQAKR
jgi:uncharacterized protein (DUF1499 family)